MPRRDRLITLLAATLILACTLHGREEPARAEAETRRVGATWTYDVTARPKTERFRLIVALPRTVANRQTIRSLRFSPEPTRKDSEGGNDYAIWDIRNPLPSTRISVDVDLDLHRADLPTLTARAKANGLPPTPKSFDAWLKPEKFIETDSPQVRAAAPRIVGDGDLSTLRGIHAFVLRTLKPSQYTSGDRGAAWALDNDTGDCSEYSDLFVALCRARNIPAFTAEGFVTTAIKENDTPKHAWVEAYIKGVGWVPFDPFHSASGSASFDRLEPTRILTSVRRTDPKLDGYHHWQFRYWGEPVEVKDSFEITAK